MQPYSEIRKKIKAEYPKLRFIVPVDREFAEVSLKELEDEISKNWQDGKAVRKLFDGMLLDQRFDCDDYALQFKAAMKARRPRWPIFGCIGKLHEGPSTTDHSRCLIVVNEGVKIIECEDIPPTILDADNEEYSVYFVH